MSRVLGSLTLAALLATFSSTAQARGETNSWVGRLTDDRTVILTASRVDGNDWVLRRNGSNLGNYEAVARTQDYLELQAKGGSELVRLYADRMEVSTGPGSRFVPIANGRWQ